MGEDCGRIYTNVLRLHIMDRTSLPRQAPRDQAMSDTASPGTWKTRRMIGGQWRDPAAVKARTKRADRIIAVRMTEAELAELDARIAVLGLKRNRALRIAARRIGGFVEADAATLTELKAIRQQLTGIARNVNQIARAANRTQDPDYRAFMKLRDGLGRELARVGDLLFRMMDLSARREDGLARLSQARDQDT